MDRYRSLVEQHAPGLVVGFYLHGSIGLGAFRDGRSDVDFVAILGRRVDDRDVQALELVHRTLTREHPPLDLDGVYLQREDLQCPADEVGPPPCYFGGQLHRVGSRGVNPITWWMLKQHAVTVFGPASESLGIRIAWEDVRAYMLANLDAYWADWASSPARLRELLTDAGVEWAVLGISRLVYGLQEGALVSKAGAGEYALAVLPERWHPPVREALFLHSGEGARTYRWRFARALEAAAFVANAIVVCRDGGTVASDTLHRGERSDDGAAE